MRIIRIVSAAIVASFAFAASARAQWADNMGGGWNNPISASISSMIWDDIWYGSQRREIMRQYEKGGSARPAAPPPTTTFRPSGQRAILAKFRPENRAQAPQLLAACDQIYTQTMVKTGGATASTLNDLSASMVFAAALGHYMYWDGQPGAPLVAQPAHMQALRAQVRERLLASRWLPGKTDADKQGLHDALVVSTCSQFLQYNQAKKANNEPQKQSMRQHASQLLTKIGLSPTALQFKPDGTVAIAAARKGG
jgi:hypothetical protein